MTLVWFVAWLIADRIGDREVLTFDPVNLWAALLILAVALDLNRPQLVGGRPRRGDRR